ncbi:PDDEXK_3 family protein (fragment) [Candidatus Desulfosporosinus infrequens]|uniref:PDDEXK_3 family protein n=1 Tax=Candidatus Desulfosporosinus infrequens TaxID=2043169 RepID=A0A2U3L7A2_9FIRM
MAKMEVNEETIIINYLKVTGLNWAFINFGEYQLRYKRFIF